MERSRSATGVRNWTCDTTRTPLLLLVSQDQQFIQILHLVKISKVSQPAEMLSGSRWLTIAEMESLKQQSMVLWHGAMEMKSYIPLEEMFSVMAGR